MPVAASQEKSAYHTVKVGTRVVTGSLFTVPIRFFMAVGSLFLVLLVLIAALIITKLIHDNYQVVQQKLREDQSLRDIVILFVNTGLGFVNLMQKQLQFLVEIWNYIVPSLNLAAYIFYRIFAAVFLTLFGQGQPQSNDSGDPAMPLGATPDPVGVLTGGVTTFLNFLECILIDLLTLWAGMFKVLMRALGAILVVVFNWLDQNLRQQWYRKEYCRMGAAYGDDWSTTTDPNNPSVNIFSGGSGPGNTCPDNTIMIQGLTRFYEMIINLVRDIFIMVFPIIADLFKMVFDALMKILPQIMEGLVKIIEIFAPDQPLGKILMYLVNFMIQVLGFFIRSCVLQLVISIVMCFFNVGIALITNVLHGVLDVIITVICLGGTICELEVPGDYVDFPSCDWTAFTNCTQQNYDNQQRNVTGICQIPSCHGKLKGTYMGMHQKMKAAAPRYSSTEEYKLDYYRACLDIHSKGKNGEETVEGHLFCRYLTEEVHRDVPLGVDPSNRTTPFEDGGDLCMDVQNSCVCRYSSPICESETCCLTYFNILVQQILEDLKMESCDVWDKKYIFAQAYCISRTHRSLQLDTKDLLGTATHCDGFVTLMNQTCNADPHGLINIKGIVGGMCNWVDRAGFCNDFRRPNNIPSGLDKLAAKYNDHLRGFKEHKKAALRSGSMMGLDPITEGSPFSAMSPHYYTDHYNDMRHAIQDHYDVTFHVMSEAFPILRGMIIPKSYDKKLGTGGSDVKLDPNIHLSDGRFRNIRREENLNWKDYDGQLLHGLNILGNPINWRFVGDHGAGDPYVAASTCTDETGQGYPGNSGFECQKSRMGGTASATGGSITNLVGPGQAQDKIDDMVSNSSQPVYTKTTNRPTFQTPTTRYVGIMYNQDIHTPSGWTPADSQRNNQNPNWRIPLTTKVNIAGDRPPGFTIYGTQKPQEEMAFEQCPIPADFPWEKVFKQRKTFLTPLQAMIEKIPEWTDKNIPDVPKFDVPEDIRGAMHLMYGKRKNNLQSDAKKVARATTQLIKTFADLQTSWEKVKDKVWSNREARKNGEETETLFSSSLRGLPTGSLWGINPNPQGSNTHLCVNRLLKPYECCTDDATAYECCYGLIGCIPSPPQINITLVNNIDFIINASCSTPSATLLSIFALPRFVFGTYVWSLVFISPTWLRPFLFKVFYPLLYDYGGRGIFANFLGDLFCLFVNLYWLILIVTIILTLYILDYVYISFIREILLKVDLGRMDREVSKVKEDTDTDRKITHARLDGLAKALSDVQNKRE